jgi:putative methionine-R-sulfoxide reductase with GAF domain
LKEEEISAVMKDWGMSRREAETALKHRSYFCCPLVHDDMKVGLLFMDSTKTYAFRADAREKVLRAADSALAPIIHKVIDDLSAVAIQIELDS